MSETSYGELQQTNNKTNMRSELLPIKAWKRLKAESNFSEKRNRKF